MQVKIDGKEVEFEEDETILQLARRKGIDIPTLCYDEELGPQSRCRKCVVEVGGELVTSCDTEVREGMKIETDTEKVRKSREITDRLIEERAERLGGEEDGSPIVRDCSRCIICGKCVDVCHDVQDVGAISEAGRGIDIEISTPFGTDMENSPCTFCGQCIYRCDCDALKERDDTEKVKEALEDPGKQVIVQTAPSIRASLGEMFDLPEGSLVTGKMVSALREMGFDRVFDTDFGADLTTVEETSEFIQRLESGGELPLFTSCCPAWIKFAEYFYPEILDNLSSCKSPHIMFGAIAKSYYSQKSEIPPEEIVVVSVMPCTAKKFEMERPEMENSGQRNVDFVLTTREIGSMLKEMDIDMKNIEDGDFDEIMGTSSGSGAIFGTTGGVAESVLRSAKFTLDGEREEIEYEQVRGLEGLKEASVEIGGNEMKMAVAHGLKNVRKVLEMMEEGEEYHIVEVMACPGGCIGGGGQPSPPKEKVLRKRAEALYTQDTELEIRTANENPEIKKLYEEFLGDPLSEKSHELLHTKYRKRR